MRGEEGLRRSSQRSKILNFFAKKNNLKVVVVYSFRMHKKRHTMTSVTAVQRETTVYAYCG